MKSTKSFFPDFAQVEHNTKAIEAGYTEMADGYFLITK